MEFFRRNPIFYSVLFALIACGLAGVAYLSQLNGELKELKQLYATKSSQYDRYLTTRPTPTKSNLEAIEQNYLELYEEFQRTMGVLDLNTFDAETYFGRTPVSRADWSFALHKFKENARFAALSNSVQLPPNVHFGFESFAEGGPPEKEGQRIHEQIVIMEGLLATLFDSGIDSFVRIQRGRKLDTKGGSPLSRRTQDKLFTESDEFIVTPQMSAAVPGVIDAYTFRLVFRGQSVALRNFLNTVTEASLPYVIRSVEVDLASEGGAKSGLESLAENPFTDGKSKLLNEQSIGVPIISDNTSLFVVTIEFLRLAVEVPAPAAYAEKGGSDA